MTKAETLAERIGRMEWQPIETAPKDGSAILGGKIGDWVGEIYWLDSWYGRDSGACWMPSNTDEEYGRPMNPTHWRPLPDPPALSPINQEAV